MEMELKGSGKDEELVPIRMRMIRLSGTIVDQWDYAYCTKCAD